LNLNPLNEIFQVLGMNATGLSHGQHINPLGIDPTLRKSQLAVQIAREILRRDGVGGYYRGYTASLLAYVPNSALWWAFYHFYQGKMLINLFQVNFKLNS
jgi:solute carrier family 25, member 44